MTMSGLVRLAACDDVGRHALTDDPEIADIVAFVGSSQADFSDIRRHRLYLAYRDKSLVCCFGDRAIPFLPGLYVCLEKHRVLFSRKSLRSGFYLRVAENESLDMDRSVEAARYLFSFVGSKRNHPVREKICSLSHERSFIRDTSDDVARQADGVGGGNHVRGLLYRDEIAESKFILCPRGIGVSSWRLFETMRAGRVPVIISDDWTPPVGPKWSLFSLTVRECDVHCIPAILEANEHKAAELGKMARDEWEHWYSKERAFNTVVEQLLLAKDGIPFEGFLAHALLFALYLDPFYFRHWFLSPLKASIKRRIVNPFLLGARP